MVEDDLALMRNREERIHQLEVRGGGIYQPYIERCGEALGLLRDRVERVHDPHVRVIVTFD